MTEFETFEVSIISLDEKHQFLSSSLQTVAPNETFQSLFDRLIEPFIISNHSYPSNNNKSLISSPLSQSSSCSSDNKFDKIDKSDIKTIECHCYSNLNSSQEIGCNVSLSFNVHSTSKRHDFLRIIYHINNIPLHSHTIETSKNNIKHTSQISPKQSSKLISRPKRYSKFHELANHLNKSRSQSHFRKGKKITMKYKIYSQQESLLTLLFIVPEFKSMYFIFLAGFLLFFTSIIIDDIMNKGEVFHSFELIKWNFKYYNQLITTWIYMLCYSFLLVLLFFYYKHSMYFFNIISQLIPNNKKYLYDYIYIICYIIYMIPLLIYPAIWAMKYNIAGSLIVACEQTRFILKSHAFFVETFKTKRYYDKYLITNINNDIDDEKCNEKYNKKLLLDKKLKKDKPVWLVDINMNLADLIINFAYFLFIPMLVYRTKYPRTKKIKWNKVFCSLRDVILSICAVWVLFCKFCIPIYRKTLLDPGNISTLFSEFINGSLPGMMLLLLGFFGFLHSWLNLFAELLRFGDRKFYEDWWNARSFAQYYRKWNCVVHDWIYNYLYLPVIEAGYSKTFAMAIVFGTSSIIHEYILILGCKFFYPVLLFLFGGLGVFFVPLTRLWRNAKGWNIFLWSMLLIGQGVLLVLYSREWFARNLTKNDINLKFIDQNSWIPNSIQLFLKRDQIIKLNL